MLQPLVYFLGRHPRVQSLRWGENDAVRSPEDQAATTGRRGRRRDQRADGAEDAGDRGRLRRLEMLKLATAKPKGAIEAPPAKVAGATRKRLNRFRFPRRLGEYGSGLLSGVLGGWEPTEGGAWRESGITEASRTLCPVPCLISGSLTRVASSPASSCLIRCLSTVPKTLGHWTVDQISELEAKSTFLSIRLNYLLQCQRGNHSHPSRAFTQPTLLTNSI